MKKNSIRLLVSLFLANGATALILSTLINSGVLALIGLGLVFWGALLLYVEPKQEYVDISLLNSTSISLLEIIDQITSSLNYSGEAVYLPPKYFKEPNKEKMFLNWGKGTSIPRSEEVDTDRLLVDNPLGLVIFPPGLGLTNFYEEKMDTSFSKIGLPQLEETLSKLFTQDLDIADNIEIEIIDDQILITLTEHIYKDLCLESYASSCKSLCCPMCSSLALAIARASNKPVIVEDIATSQDGNMLEVLFRLCRD